MAYLADISFRRALALFSVAMVVLLGGTWIIVKTATTQLVHHDAKDSARNWARFLVANVADLKQIAAGELPSSASLAFFKSAQKSDDVYKFIIFNPYGYSQFRVDRHSVGSLALSTFNANAKAAAATGTTIVETSNRKMAGDPAHFASAYVPVGVAGKPVGVVASFVDESAQIAYYRRVFVITVAALCVLIALAFAVPAIAWYRRTKEKQQADRRIHYLAHHDPLTGLANRRRLVERLDAALAILPSTGCVIAVHFIDLDHFKQVNDTLGHDGGDFLLTTIGQRLRAVARMEDMVARLGGDEFVVVHSNITDETQAQAFAQRISSALSAPTYFKEQEIRPGVTVGVALAPADGNSPEQILKSADLALHNGKSAGRARICFFTPEMDEALRKRIELERSIRDAMDDNRLEAHYQPIFEVDGRRFIGFEALARLTTADGTSIPPKVFIPVAEEMRLIDTIGARILQQACRAAALWPEGLTVAVNLSPAQFESGMIESAVVDALSESGLAPHRLELEITESLLLRNSANTMATLERLKALGVQVVMDDFGTGYSSLSYLWKFPFDKIKIDRSFMEGFQNSGRDVEEVVKTIIALGRQLNMRVTVEGVETPDQVDFLYDADADQVQGFYFGRPVPASEVSADILRDFYDERHGTGATDTVGPRQPRRSAEPGGPPTA